jgi:lysine 2,3-aminomutase
MSQTHNARASGLRSARDLDLLPMEPEERARNQEAEQAYLVRAPASYVSLIDWRDPRDPIRLQTIPSAKELQWDPRESGDPIGDQARSPVPRLTHRYPDRVLLYPTYQCAVYCRHCFRKEALEEKEYDERSLQPALDYIDAHPALREVILTGGDPLVLSDARLAWLRERLDAISHLRMLRLHTRVPVVLPQRIRSSLVEALSGRLMVSIVTHFNHVREITPECAAAARLLRGGGFMLLNQTVLLKGVNDTPDALAALFQELVYTLGIKPYYLHHCDTARGLTHFRTTIDEGLDLMAALRGRISGLCQPQYVLDLPGGKGKIPLGSARHTHGREGFEWVFRSPEGHLCPYSEIVPENPPPRHVAEDA